MGYKDYTLDKIQEEYESRYGLPMDIDYLLQQALFLGNPNDIHIPDFILESYILKDQELGFEVEERVEDHLSRCEQCRAAAREKEQAF